MSVYFNQTNITPGTSQFITRAEVIEGLSTLAGDLSGINISTLIFNPNPVVSSLTVNGSGTISQPAAVNSTRYVVSSITGSITSVRPYGNNNTFIGITEYTGNAFTDIYAKNHVAQNLGQGSNNDRILFGYQGVTGITQGGVVQPFATWYSGFPSGSNWVLNNVSSINGAPVGTGGGITSYTTLTGSNINNSGVINTPSMVGLSSLNGLPYQPTVQNTFTGSNNATVGTNSATSVFTVPLAAGTLAINRAYIYDFPIVLGNFPPSPINFQLLIGVRLGGNGQINYSLPYWIATNSVQPVSLNLTGVANTNTTSLGGQTMEVIFLHNAGSTWTCPVYAPPSAGGVNTYTVKLLDA